MDGGPEETAPGHAHTERNKQSTDDVFSRLAAACGQYWPEVKSKLDLPEFHVDDGAQLQALEQAITELESAEPEHKAKIQRSLEQHLIERETTDASNEGMMFRVIQLENFANRKRQVLEGLVGTIRLHDPTQRAAFNKLVEKLLEKSDPLSSTQRRLTMVRLELGALTDAIEREKTRF